MYIELNNVSNWIKHHSPKSKSKRLNRSDTVSKPSEVPALPTNIPAKFVQSKRLGANKFQQVVKKVLAKFFESNQENKNKGKLDGKNDGDEEGDASIIDPILHALKETRKLKGEPIIKIEDTSDLKINQALKGVVSKNKLSNITNRRKTSTQMLNCMSPLKNGMRLSQSLIDIYELNTVSRRPTMKFDDI